MLLSIGFGGWSGSRCMFVSIILVSNSRLLAAMCLSLVKNTFILCYCSLLLWHSVWRITNSDNTDSNRMYVWRPTQPLSTRISRRIVALIYILCDISWFISKQVFTEYALQWSYAFVKWSCSLLNLLIFKWNLV
jgi:hypothetical protein